MSVPEVSVVIPSCGRPELLARCLKALAVPFEGTPEFEVVVVDDGHHDAAGRLVQELGDPPFRYLRTARPRSGPAAARNIGWRAARAPVVAFTDDDTVPAHDWLLQGMRAMREGVDAASGRVRVPIPERPRDHERQTAGLESAEFVTANCFVRRAALQRVGGFDERFRLAWREDSDLQFSLLACGACIVQARSAVVWHPVRPARWGDSLRQQRKVFFDALLFKKHPHEYRARIRSKPRWDYYAIVGLLVLGVGCALAGEGAAAVATLSAWAASTAVLVWRRLHRASHAPAHALEMLATSIAIPPAAVYWRLRGALHFRVAFL